MAAGSGYCMLHEHPCCCSFFSLPAAAKHTKSPPHQLEIGKNSTDYDESQSNAACWPVICLGDH